MKRMLFLGIISLLVSPIALAEEPVTLSGPSPALAPSYSAGTSNTVIYTITNKVPKRLPVTVSGISKGITRTKVENDCGELMPAGPSTCNIGIDISPTVLQTGSSVSQMLQVNYQGRQSLNSFISYSVIQPYTYVTPTPNASLIYKCPMMAANGDLATCLSAYKSDTQHFGKLTFAVVDGEQYAYTVDAYGFVYQCWIDKDGSFTTCKSALENSPSWMPYGIAFAKVGKRQYAYVTDVNEGSVYKCTLKSDGSFRSCDVMVSGAFAAPYGIAVATVRDQQYVYVTNAGNGPGTFGSINRCPLDDKGDFDTCYPTPGLMAPEWIPYAIAFTTAGGEQYAYVADNGISLSTGHVYKCTLKKNGSFKTCISTPQPDAPTTNWVPSDIAFATLGGIQYAYVGCYQANYGDLYSCIVKNDGSLSSCSTTPVKPPLDWTPVGVANRFS